MFALIVGLAALVLVGAPPQSQGCATDLQSRIDATPDGGNLDLTGQCFLSEQTIVIRNRSGITITGGELIATTDGSDVPAASGKRSAGVRARSHLAILGSRGITVLGMKVRSVNVDGAYVAGLEAQHGFLVSDGSSGTRIQGVEVDDVYGDCVAIADATSTFVTGADCDHIGRQGMSITDAVDTHIEDSIMRQVARSVFDLEPIGRIGQRIENTWIENNTIYGPYGNITFGTSGSGDIVNTYIRNNQLVGVHLRTKLGASDNAHANGAIRSGIHFTGNTVDTAPPGAVAPVVVQNATDVHVAGNTVPVKNDGTAWLSWRNVSNFVVGENSSNGVQLEETDERRRGRKGGDPAQQVRHGKLPLPPAGPGGTGGR